MVDVVVELRVGLQEVVASLDAEVLTPGEAARLLRELSTIERSAAAGKALLARRVADSGG